ncbi:hypothetical protein ACFU99_36790 [Streptomyces sp. NPDC057654]|uniref:hypothetical protein n=1 Tax=Streptomyces sp. NPDC057654 TaxID=3346196 RepID=UPI0036B5A0A0
MSTAKTPSRSRFPLYVAGIAELVVLFVAGVLVLAAGLAQAVLDGLRGYAGAYAKKHKVTAVFPGARAQVAAVLFAEPAVPAAVAVPKKANVRKEARS